MKTNNRYRVKASRINSLDDLRREKMRLRMEIVRTEEHIHTGYREIIAALTFRNLANHLVQDLTTTSSIVSKTIAIGKVFLTRRKKKRHDREQAAANLNANDF